MQWNPGRDDWRGPDGMRLNWYLGRLQSLGVLWCQIPRYSWEDDGHRNATWNGNDNSVADDDGAEGTGTQPKVSLPHFGYGEGNRMRQVGGENETT